MPAMGVMTAPGTRYAVNIHDDMPYETLNSLMRSGIAGINIVSAYMTIVAMLLRTASTFQAEAGIFAGLAALSFSSNVPKFSRSKRFYMLYLLKDGEENGSKMNLAIPKPIFSASASSLVL